jgi:hypothetical protein
MTKTWEGGGGGEGRAGNTTAPNPAELAGVALGPTWAVPPGPQAPRASRAARIAPVIVARRRPWQVLINPERGGRIASLRLDDEELLDQGIGVDQPTAPTFVEAGAWGWDEMVPNVEPTETLPDHGEAWRLPWEVLWHNYENNSMECGGRSGTWILNRHMLIRHGIELNYSLTNQGSEPIYAYWCAHPLFRYEPDMEVDLDVPRPLEGKSAKVFVPPGSVDHATLRWRSGTGVRMSWDTSLTPYLGVWVCNGDLGGYRQIAIEPATGGNDKPDPSAPPPVLQPGETYRWRLQIQAL